MSMMPLTHATRKPTAVACRCLGNVWWETDMAVGNMGPSAAPIMTKPAASVPMEVACHTRITMPQVMNRYNVTMRFSPNIAVM